MFNSKKIIGIIIIILTLIFKISSKINYNLEISNQEKIINKINNGEILEYLGYIEIPKINLKKVIMPGTTKSILEKNIGLLEGKTLESKNIVLAGHNRVGLFNKIKELQKGDIVYINTIYQKKYEVIKKIKIDIDELEYFDETSENILTLITCTDNNKKRLLIICKKVL